MKRKLFLTLGLLGVMVASMFGNAAEAHDRRDYRDGWGNNRGGWNQRDCRDNRRSWRQDKRSYRAANRSNGWRNNNRVSYRPGNRWDNYRPAPRRGWW